MTKKKDTFEPGRGYSREDWDAVESPEATDDQLARARPFGDFFPQPGEPIKRGRGRPRVDQPREQISLRLDPEVIEKFKATGPGWQGRINDILKAAKV